MAKGHKKVIRRSLTPEEWIRLRLRDATRWKEIASCPTSGWEIREARYDAPGDYTWLSPWRRIRQGELWGSPDGTFFFRAKPAIPQEFRGLPVLFELSTPTEMLVRIDGKLVNGIDPNRSRVPLVGRARGGETFAMELEAYVRSYPDDMRVVGGGGWGCTQAFRNPRLVCPDRVVESFLYDFQTALDVALCPQVDEEVRESLLHRLDETLKRLDRDTDDRRTYHQRVAAAKAYLRTNVYEARGLASAGALALVGHSHVDIAYHWRIRQGIRKNARTAAVQLALMKEYPELLYCHSQPYLHETLKKHYPDLFRRVKAKVRSGQWELVGATYVEPDCNVPSGESLIRQCLLGKLFYLKEFGADVDTCWLPDVFGNSWMMPQILARSGIRYFVSNKMSTWNDTNEFPHTNFIWRGLDGTEVFACVPPSHFNSWLAPEQLLANWDGFKEKATIGESMHMCGFGDGGGGVTREMLETARRIKKFPGLPRTRLVTAKGYLDEAFRKPEELEVWDDELYLEMHRGTTTTQAALKKLNRRCELEAREAEMFAVLAEPYGFAIPRKQLTQAWKAVLVNQFHDILPGSHTTPVAREAEESYREALGVFRIVKTQALKALCRHISTNSLPGTPVVVFNSLGWPRTDLAEIGVDGPSSFTVLDSSGQPVPSQAVEERNGEDKLLFVAREVPSVGHRVFFLRKEQTERKSVLKASKRTLENRFFRLRLNNRGEITRLTDKRCGREVIPRRERANVLQLFEDKPGLYDAWDIVPTYKDKCWGIPPAKRMEVVETGPVRAGIVVERGFFDSRLVQRIWIYEDIPRIDFETWADWRERNKLLKVAFPVDILARHATYDLSYGSITRPTHRNTSWDKAKFEVCGHKWADLSEPGYGISLLNDCKYGWDIEGNVMRLSLLRGSVRPDPDSDLGIHLFTYSLFPHEGTWQEAGSVRAAYALNCPLTVIEAKRHGGSLPAKHSFISVEPTSVHLGALKPAEEGKGRVLRLVEQHGGRGKATVRFDRAISSIQECDLLERAERKVAARRRSFTAAMRPFEMKSFLLRLGSSRQEG